MVVFLNIFQPTGDKGGLEIIETSATPLIQALPDTDIQTPKPSRRRPLSSRIHEANRELLLDNNNDIDYDIDDDSS